MGVAETIQQGFNNISNQLLQVGMAKAKLQQQKEQFEAKKKVEKAQIDYYEKRGDILDLDKEIKEKEWKEKAASIEKFQKILDRQAKKMKEGKETLNNVAAGIQYGRQTVNVGGQEYQNTATEKGMAGLGYEPVDATPNEKLDRDLQRAANGEISWEAVKRAHPRQMEEIEIAEDYFVRQKPQATGELKKPSKVSDEDWRSANEETKRELMRMF